MSDEIQTDATKALAEVKGAIAAVDADAAKVKAWYKAFPFYAGLIAGALAAVIVLHIL
jgi:hypothetical protein